MSNDQIPVTDSPEAILNQMREDNIKATKKLVVKKLAVYATLIAGLAVVARLTNVELDETEEVPSEE